MSVSFVQSSVNAAIAGGLGGSSDPHFESEKKLEKQRTHAGKAPPAQGQLTFLATTDLNPPAQSA
jgi:hypothetical protein